MVFFFLKKRTRENLVDGFPLKITMYLTSSFFRYIDSAFVHIHECPDIENSSNLGEVKYYF